MGPLATSRVALACGENLSKSGAVMHDRLQGSLFQSAGRSTGWGFLLAGMFGVLVACSSDDSAPQTGSGGQAQNVTGAADAGRPLPGEGFEATPDFDITNPQRPVPPREQLVAGAANLNGTGGSSGRSSRTPDAGAATNDAGPL